MSDYALYRYPEAHTYHAIRGKAETVDDIIELKDSKGFVIAPFHIGGNEPMLLIPANQSEEHTIPDCTGEHAQIIGEESHRDDYHHAFATFHRALCDGRLGKVVLSRRLDITLDRAVDPQEIFFNTCRRYPHQMIVLVHTQESGTWLMATPEVLMEKDHDRWNTMALAGTMTTPGPWSNKNIEEQFIVARYILNCIARRAYFIQHSTPHVATAANLYHLRTDFTFICNNDGEVFQVLSDLHPTPAVCGIPKEEAMNIILNGETMNRKYYSGFSGPIGIDDETHLFVSLRCMEIDGRNCHLYAGGGLLKESVEEDEWKETEVKLNTMRDVLRQS